MIENTLTQLGLTNSEIKVYFALLELETSTSGKIIKKAKITHSKIYNILEKLIEKGLVSYIIKNNVKHFQATEPENLIRILEKKELEIKQQKQEIKKIIPIIKEKRKLKKDKQEATVYEGIKGMRSAYQVVLNTMKKGETYRVLHVIDQPLQQKEVSLFYKQYHRERAKKGINVKFIGHKKEKELVLKNFNQPKSELRLTNEAFPIGVVIFKNYTLTTIWGENPTAILVKSESNYNYYKKYFDHLWDKLESEVINP